MELFASNSSSSSSSSSPATMHLFQCQQQQLEQKGGSKVAQSFHSSLRSIRNKPQMKPLKKPIAPLPPTPPRIYKVDPINFRDLVQKLTGAPEPDYSEQPSSHRLQRVAPPPLELEKETAPALFSREFSFSGASAADSKASSKKVSSDTITGSRPFEFELFSPSSHIWCSYPLLSPGTLSSLEQSTVL